MLKAKITTQNASLNTGGRRRSVSYGRKQQQHTPRTAVNSVPPETVQELQVTFRKLNLGKAPGPHGIPNESLKIATAARPEMFVRVYDNYFINGHFSIHIRKRANLVLVPKSGKPHGLPSSYHACVCSTPQESCLGGQCATGWSVSQKKQERVSQAFNMAGRAGRPWMPGRSETAGVMLSDV